MSCCGQQAKAILFPEPTYNEGYQVTDAADENLESAIYDLTRTGHADLISLKTLERVLDQLRKARDVLA